MSNSQSRISPFLADLKVAQLQNIARLIGLSTGGTKTELKTRLIASLPRSRFIQDDRSMDGVIRPGDSLGSTKNRGANGQTGSYRILSIDMGIRNLAYCSLSLDRAWVDSDAQNKHYLSRPTTQLLWWRRLALSTLEPGQEDEGECASLKSLDDSGKAASKELFTPPHLAPVALRVLHDLVLRPIHDQGPPHLILIERQRWRSGGGAAVQEWTLRVNSLEAMLWAGLEVLRGAGLWSGEVRAIDPKIVGRFWVPTGLESGKGGKEMKVKVVKGWFAEDSGASESIKCCSQADQMKKAFMSEKSPSGRRTSKAKIEELQRGTDSSDQSIAKRDDLADCFLQGMAWIRWEENRRAINAGGLTLE